MNGSHRGNDALKAAVRRARARIPATGPHMQLLRFLVANFTLEQLNAIAFELGADPDRLTGDTVADRARCFVLNVRRFGGEAWLLQALHRHRPDLAQQIAALEQALC